MTNQEAIRNLKDIKEIIYEVFPMTEEDKELSLDLAIKALEKGDRKIISMADNIINDEERGYI